jgi:hypothetical protein
MVQSTVLKSHSCRGMDVKYWQCRQRRVTRIGFKVGIANGYQAAVT